MKRPSDWIIARRIRWRLIYLIAVLGVITGFLLFGWDLKRTLGATFLIFLLGAVVSRWFVDDAPLPNIGKVIEGVFGTPSPTGSASATRDDSRGDHVEDRAA